jgi:hypothetical protein
MRKTNVKQFAVGPWLCFFSSLINERENDSHKNNFLKISEENYYLPIFLYVLCDILFVVFTIVKKEYLREEYGNFDSLWSKNSMIFACSEFKTKLYNTKFRHLRCLTFRNKFYAEKD